MQFTTSSYTNLSDLLNEGFAPVQPISLEASWGRPLSGEITAAYTLQMEYAARLMESVARGDIEAIRERQDYLLHRRPFVGYRDAQQVLREAHVHTTDDFVNLTASLANHRLLTLWKEKRDEEVWKAYVFIEEEDRTDFQEHGVLTFEPYRSGSTHGQPLAEGGTFTRWLFKERKRGKFAVHIFADGFVWSYKLQISDKYGGLASALPSMVNIQLESKSMFMTQLHVGESGPHPSVYNKEYNNIVPGNPPLSLASLEKGFAHAAEQKDVDGQPIKVDRRKWVLVVGSYALKQRADKIVNAGIAANTIKLTTEDSDGQTIQLETKTPSIPEVEVVWNANIRSIATMKHPKGGTYADHSWSLFPKPKAGSKNPLVAGHLTGFRRSPQLYRKVSNTARLNGRILQQMGSFDTMNQEVKSVQAFGGGFVDPEWTFASNGTGK